MSVSANKRRRLDAQNALLKPFRSPLRRSTPKTTETRMRVCDIPQRAATGIHPDSTVTNEPAGPDLLRKLPHIPKSSVEQRYSTEVAALQLQQTTLLRQLNESKSELDKVVQALKIERSSRDSELRALFRQWRSVSQLAAEEVYATVRDRVNGMGGLQAWRDREREQKQNAFAGWSIGDEEQGRTERDDGNFEPSDVTEADPQQDVEDEESEDFSMELMLRTLNIDTESIGYDKENQRWTDP